MAITQEIYKRTGRRVRDAIERRVPCEIWRLIWVRTGSPVWRDIVSRIQLRVNIIVIRQFLDAQDEDHQGT